MIQRNQTEACEINKQNARDKDAFRFQAKLPVIRVDLIVVGWQLEHENGVERAYTLKGGVPADN